MKIEIKSRWNGKVIFSHECEDNTVKKTVIEAVKQEANLREADLWGADLREAGFCGANGNCREIKTIQTDIWHVCMTENVMQIGCKQYTLKEWENFSGDEIREMDRQALRFCKKWKKLLFKIHKKSFPEAYK